MKQRKLCAGDIDSSSEACNGHVRISIKRTIRNEFQSTNGNRCRNMQIKTDKPKNEAYAHEPQIKCHRSQRCRSHNHTVQTCFRKAPIYSIFAFHWIVLFIVILLFTGCCVTNGQQIDSQLNAQNTGE